MRKAFTLVELLVVIAIIGLIASIVLVNLQGTRQRGRVAAGKQFSSQLQNTLGNQAVGIWRLNEGSGTTAYDNAGYGNNGTLTGTVLPSWQTEAECILETCLFFDGSSSGNNATVLVSETSSSPLNILGDVTISIWIQPSSSYTDTSQAVLRNGQGSDLVYSVFYDPVNQRPFFHWYDGAFRQVNGIANSAPMDRWSHVVVSRNGSSLSFYVNGAFTNTEIVTTPTVLASSLAIGRTNNVAVPQDYSGLIDDVSIYSSPLTTAQIRQLYAEGLPAHQLVQQ